MTFPASSTTIYPNPPGAAFIKLNAAPRRRQFEYPLRSSKFIKISHTAHEQHHVTRESAAKGLAGTVIAAFGRRAGIFSPLAP
jgi:hypothetical protein